MTEALVDNDVVLKACCYGLDAAVVSVLRTVEVTPSMLPLARYVVSGRIRRDKSLARREVALIALGRVVATFGVVEPDEREIRLAATFERAAQAHNLELDGGESQLLAILISRGLKVLITGDKRAIRAIEQIAEDPPCASIACLEQLVGTILSHLGVIALRQCICAEPSVDRTLTTCFACHSPAVELASVKEGLSSYVSDLRKAASRVLIRADDLSALVP